MEAPRRPAAGRPDQRAGRTSAASRGSPATAGRSPPSGSSPRRCSCSRRTRRSTSGAERWIEAADWIIWQLTGVETRNACTAGYKGICQDGRYPSARLPGRAGPAVRRLRGRQAGASDPAARRAGRVADRAGGRVDRPARGHRGRGRQRRRARHRRPPRHAIAPGQMVAIMGTSTCHVMNGDRRSPRCRACAASSTAASCAGCGATRPGRAASATSSPGSSTTPCPPRYHDEADRARHRVHELLSAEAAAQPVGAHGLIALDWLSGNRSVLVDHDLSGADRRPDAGHPAAGDLPGAGRGDRVRHPGDHRGVRRRRRPGHRAGGRRRAAARTASLMQIYADVTAPPAEPDRLRAGPGAGLGDPRRGRRRRLPRRPGRRGGDGRQARGRLPARPGQRRRLRPAVRRVPCGCTTTSAAAANEVMHRLRAMRDEAVRQRGRQPCMSTRPDADPVTAAAIARASGRRSATCTPSWSATGLVAWTSGNISARVPGADLMVIKPSGVAYDELTPESMVVCDLDGARRSSGELSPSSDTATHAYVYRHMPEVGGVVHTHSPYATAWAARGEADPVRAHRDGRRVRRRDPGRAVRADRRRRDRPRHRGDAVRPPLARRADAQPRRVHHRRAPPATRSRPR